MIDIPGYVIKREIGSGGMASVHLAVQTSLEREVALKVMSPSLASDPTFSKRFLQEARMLASLAHPNIVAVYDVGVTPGQLHYFSMQYLPGGDFASRVQHGMEERDLTLTLAGVARALGYAHQRGYVHRDVAPGNILFQVISLYYGLLKKSFSAGCSKMARCKAPEILRNEAYSNVRRNDDG